MLQSEHRGQVSAKLEASGQGCSATLGQGVWMGYGGVCTQAGEGGREGGDSSGRDVSAGSPVLPVPPRKPALASPAERWPTQTALPEPSPGGFGCFGLVGADTNLQVHPAGPI